MKFFDSDIEYDNPDYYFSVVSSQSKEKAFEDLKFYIDEEEHEMVNIDCLKEMVKIKPLTKIITDHYLFSDSEHYRFFKYNFSGADYDQHPTAVYDIQNEQTTAGFPNGNSIWNEPTMKTIKLLERKRKIKNIINEY